MKSVSLWFCDSLNNIFFIARIMSFNYLPYYFNSCVCYAAGWSEKGDSMIIKDIKQFAATIIPTAYKHNNFSSFVRQLNFCK